MKYHVFLSLSLLFAVLLLGASQSAVQSANAQEARPDDASGKSTPECVAALSQLMENWGTESVSSFFRTGVCPSVAELNRQECLCDEAVAVLAHGQKFEEPRTWPDLCGIQLDLQCRPSPLKTLGCHGKSDEEVFANSLAAVNRFMQIIEFASMSRMGQAAIIDTVIRNLTQMGWENHTMKSIYGEFSGAVGFAEYAALGSPAVTTFLDNGYETKGLHMQRIILGCDSYYVEYFATADVGGQEISGLLGVRFDFDDNHCESKSMNSVLYFGELLAWGGAMQDSSPAAGNLTCEFIMTHCSALRPYETMEECLSYYNALPVSSPSCTHPLVRVPGRTKQCFRLHSASVNHSPEFHCAHVSNGSLSDPNGVIKCQDPQCVDPSLIDPIERYGVLDSLASFGTFGGLVSRLELNLPIGCAESPNTAGKLPESSSACALLGTWIIILCVWKTLAALM